MTIDVGLIYSDETPLQLQWYEKCLASLEGVDLRITLANHHRNGLGVKSNRIQTLRGPNEFMTYVDYDDWVEPRAFGRAVQVLQDNPGLGGVYFQSWIVDAQGKFIRAFHAPGNKWSYTHHMRKMNHVRQLCVFRREVYEKVLGRCAMEAEVSFDRCLTFAIGMVAGWKYDPTVSYYFRDHPAGQHHQYDKIKSDYDRFVKDVQMHGV